MPDEIAVAIKIDAAAAAQLRQFLSWEHIEELAYCATEKELPPNERKARAQTMMRGVKILLHSLTEANRAK